jgi:hypothetical protein
MRSLVCVEYVVDCQILFSALNAIWAFRMRAIMSASVLPVLSIMLPRYVNCVTLSIVLLYIRRGSLLFRAICISFVFFTLIINPLNAELNPISHLLALLGAHLIFHVSRIRVKPAFAEKIAHEYYVITLVPRVRSIMPTATEKQLQRLKANRIYSNLICFCYFM